MKNHILKTVLIAAVVGIIAGHIQIGGPDNLPNVQKIGTVYIEIDRGQVLNDSGDGVILNTQEDYYNYISYAGTDNVKPGDIVTTVCIYNPATTWNDDIIARFDF